MVDLLSRRRFLEAALLLYGGPWVAERYAAVGEFIASHPDDVHPVVRDIVLGGVAVAGADVFRGRYRLAELERRAAPTLRSIDALLLPTTPFHPTIDAVLADPVDQNAALGRFTNFVNLMNLAAVAVPAGFTREGLPFGVTVVGTALSDYALLRFADACCHPARRCARIRRATERRRRARTGSRSRCRWRRRRSTTLRSRSASRACASPRARPGR